MAAAMSEARVQDHAYRVYAGRSATCASPRPSTRFPRAHAREALERALALVERRRLPILFPFEVRFAAGDDAFLSTAHERETCYIAAHQYTGMEFESFFRGFEEIMDDYDGRPHWGKRHYQTAATLRERYPRVGPLPGGARAPRSRRRVRQRLHPPGARSRRRAGAFLMLTAARRLARYDGGVRRLDAPFAFVDLDAMWSNSADMLARSRRQADPRRVEVAALPGAAAHDPRPRRRLSAAC